MPTHREIATAKHRARLARMNPGSPQARRLRKQLGPDPVPTPEPAPVAPPPPTKKFFGKKKTT